MTECKEVGYKKIPGADHAHPTYHYEMMPGEAYRMDDKTGEWEPVKVDKAIADQAEQQFNLYFVKGRTVAEFWANGRRYAQPIPLTGMAKAAVEKAERKQAKKEKSIVTQVKEEKSDPKQAAPPPVVTQGKKEPKRDPPSKRAKGLRKGGYGLD